MRNRRLLVRGTGVPRAPEPAIVDTRNCRARFDGRRAASNFRWRRCVDVGRVRGCDANTDRLDDLEQGGDTRCQSKASLFNYELLHGGVMEQSSSQFPEPAIQEYNCHDDSPGGQNPPSGGTPQVTVPADPPEFGPVAARALLRLLVAVHRVRGKNLDTAGEEP